MRILVTRWSVPPALLVLALLLSGCNAGARRADASGQTNEASAPAIAANGAITASGSGVGATPTFARNSAIDDARRRLTPGVEEAVERLAQDLRPAVEALDEADALRRFESARSLAAREALAAASLETSEVYLEPDGGYSAAATLSVHAGDPALRLYERLRDAGRLASSLAETPAWENLRQRAASRRAQRAELPPIPPIGAEEAARADADDDPGAP